MSTTVLSDQPISKAVANTMTKAGVHLPYMDTLRAILITLVIALHTAIAYGASGDWTYVDPQKSELAGILLSLVTGIVQSFSLGLYFFISGYFTPGSYDRKGMGRFWKDRLIRLGIPLVVYTFALSRIPQFFAGRAMGMVSVSFWEFSRTTFITQADEGPTWFIFALLLFLVGYSIWRWISLSISPDKLTWIKRVSAPGKMQIMAFGLVVAVLMFVIGLKSKVGETIELFDTFNLMTIFFAQYILFFMAGILAYRNHWLTDFKGKDLRFWSWLSLGLGFALPLLFAAVIATGDDPETLLGGFYWQSAAFMLWVGLFSVSFSMTLILWLRDGKASQNRILSFAEPNSYAVYLIHPLILIPLTVAFTPVSFHPLLKFVIVLSLVVTLCFVASDFLRRLPGMKSII